jgi:peptidoglycan/LPS O-acetylase OafA/YrhL
MCYTIYLYHTIVLRGLILELPIARVIFDAMGPAWGMAVVLVTATGTLLILCSVFFVLFERPFMQRSLHSPPLIVTSGSHAQSAG